jgi:hypothetical protein
MRTNGVIVFHLLNNVKIIFLFSLSHTHFIFFYNFSVIKLFKLKEVPEDPAFSTGVGQYSIANNFLFECLII